jgi:Arc/MetJ-type ribon-helix-helix transcriptional regulator
MDTQTFNIALPRDLVNKVDEVAKREYRNRSELIREALRTYLKDAEEWGELFSYGKMQGRKLGIEDEGDVNMVVDDFRRPGRPNKSSS